MKKKSKISPDYSVKRRYIRFQPEHDTCAWLELDVGSDGLKFQIPGLVLEEAYGGCAVVVRAVKTMKVGKKCRIQTGRLHSLAARIVWVKDLGSELLKLGIEYLE